MSIVKGLTTIGKILSKHSPEILTAIGVIGLVSAGISAVRNTPIALERMQKEKEETNEEVIPVKRKVELCWKQYIFPIVIAIISIACIIFARKIDSGRTAALLTACKVSEEAAERFKQEAREVVGDDKVSKIEDRLAKKEMQSNEMVDSDVCLTNTGTTLYYECYSGRYFRANRDFVDRARNVFCGQLQDYDTMSVNDYLECFDLPPIDDMTTGRMLGWRLDEVKKRCGGHMPELKFTYDEVKSGEVCGYMRLEVDPTINYNNYYS